MFSLIITIIAIVLVAALAIATIYYGANQLSTARAKAGATASITQGQQIIGAAQLFKADTGRWPTDIHELVSSKYLNSIPTAGFNPAVTLSSVTQRVASATGLMPTAYAADAKPWETVQPVIPYYWLHRIVPENVCRAVNLATRGDDGIYLAARPSLAVQCFGPAGQYSVIVGITGVSQNLTEAISTADPDLVVDESGSGWTVVPTITNPGGSGTGTGTTPGAGTGSGSGSGTGSDTGTTPTTPQQPAPVSPVSFTDSQGQPLTVVAFPNTEAGKTSSAIPVTVKNTSSTAINLAPTDGIAATLPFKISNSYCSSTLSPGASCLVNIVFNPTEAGSFASPAHNLTVKSPTTSWTLPLTGTGTAPPKTGPDGTPVLVTSLGGDATAWDVDFLGNTYILRLGVYPHVIDKYSPSGQLLKSGTVSGAGSHIAVDRDFYIHLASYGGWESSAYVEKFDQNYTKVGLTKSLTFNGVMKRMETGHSRHLGFSIETISGRKSTGVVRLSTDYVTREALSSSTYYNNDNGLVTRLHGMLMMPTGAVTFVQKMEGTYWTPTFGGGYSGYPSSGGGIYPLGYITFVSPLTNNAYYYDSDTRSLRQANSIVWNNTTKTYEGKVAYANSIGHSIESIKIDGDGCLRYKIRNGTASELHRSAECGF